MQKRFRFTFTLKIHSGTNTLATKNADKTIYESTPPANGNTSECVKQTKKQLFYYFIIFFYKILIGKRKKNIFHSSKLRLTPNI